MNWEKLPQEEVALNIALNKCVGKWDYPVLKEVLNGIDDGEFDVSLTGFDLKEQEELMVRVKECPHCGGEI